MTISKANITTLANEILLSIFEYLDHSSLANLNRTSQLFHVLTRTLLYQTFVGSRYGRFLRTIVSSSSSGSPLRGLVKSAKCIIAPPDDPTEGLTSAEREDICNAFRELELPRLAFQIDYQEDLASDYKIYANAIQFHWYLDLFLLFFPQLETLEVGGYLGLWDAQQPWFGFHVVSEAGYFSNLRTVKISGDVTLHNIKTLLRVPSVRELDLNRVRESRVSVAPVWNWGALGHGADAAGKNQSGLETLRIRNAELLVGGLVPILQSIRGLRRFEYDQFGHDDSSTEIIRHNGTYRELTDELIAHAATLEVIRVRIWCEGSGEYALGLLRLLFDWVNFPIYPPDGPHTPTFPQLAKLDLKTLRLRRGAPMDVFVRGVMQHLPQGLKMLRLAVEAAAHPNAPMDLEADFLNQIIDQGAFSGMGIEEVSISSRLCLEHCEWAISGGRKRVEDAFRSAGVRFTNVCTHLCTKQKPPHGQIVYEVDMDGNSD